MVTSKHAITAALHRQIRRFPRGWRFFREVPSASSYAGLPPPGLAWGLNHRNRMTDPSFLLQRSGYAKDLMQMARDLQALVDHRKAAMDQPLSGLDFDISSFDDIAEPAHRADH